MVAIPIGYDQPGTAARIAHHGTGEFIELDQLTTDRLRVLIEKVLQDPSYCARADYFQKVISKTRGLDVAADIIERALQKHQKEIRTNEDSGEAHTRNSPAKAVSAPQEAKSGPRTVLRPALSSH